MSQPYSHVATALQSLISTGAYRATKYLDLKHTVKITRQGPTDRRAKTETFLVTIGSPNYAERKFIKTLVAADEPFPVRKVQLKFKVKR